MLFTLARKLIFGPSKLAFELYVKLVLTVSGECGYECECECMYGFVVTG
jgi:hypothetical protein